jgi:hypothetical protein
MGCRKASITRLKSGTYNQSKVNGEILWKKKLFFKECDSGLHGAIDDARKEERVLKQAPRFLVVTDFETLLAYDTKTDETLDIPIEEISEHHAFFLPWAGMEKALHQVENPADIKAAEKMAKLFELIDADNPNFDQHALNVFLTRLLFCFFAEDTDIFENDAFTHSINNYTAENGSDLNAHLETLFGLLNEKGRNGYPAHFKDFPYVNGELFAEELEVPEFSAKSRRMIIESGNLGWSGINPDIFGSMFQAVTDNEKRGNLGMHYTSVPNIMKVIEPLFLDDLKEEFEKSKGNQKKLNRLLNRIWKLQIFDPACGSGNFLIIAYKELRRLEMEIFEEISEVSKQSETMLSGIHVNQFYGIEIDEFAREVAVLSLWLAAHQMNVESRLVTGSAPATLPLEDSAHITCGNATRIDWEEKCPKKEGNEIFILGNPPYLGGKMQNTEQKADLEEVFSGISTIKNLDYITCWLFKGAEFIAGSKAELAFVSTNSICQGEQVALLWPHIFQKGVEISFAHRSFKWTNSARGNAGVTCVVIGLRNITAANAVIIDKGIKKSVKSINAYLATGSNLIIQKKPKSISNFTEILFGSMPRDGGNLILSDEEKESLCEESPESLAYIKPYRGSVEFIRGISRWCVWIIEEEAKEANSVPAIQARLNAVANFRKSSKAASTRSFSDKPHRFVQISYRDAPSIIVPSVSSERRNYIPIGFLAKGTVTSNLAYAIYDPEPYLFGVLSSLMHMTWVRAVGGRLKTDYRYSAGICYNTFPFPETTEARKTKIDKCVFAVLSEREVHSEKSLSNLYDPDKMPDSLLEAHQSLDEAVEKCYRPKPFTSDEERLEHLFKLYEEMTESEPCLI